MSATVDTAAEHAEDAAGGDSRGRRRKEPTFAGERSVLSANDRRRPGVRLGLRVLVVVVVAGLLLISGGPLLWLFKSAVSTSQDIIRAPFGLWSSGIQWQNLSDAWTLVHIGRALLNTVWIALGSWFFGLLVALTGGYALSVLRPKYGPIITGAVLATLFVPGVVSLVASYLIILDVPIVERNLINTFWAVWLPAAPSAFNVLLMKRVFDRLPRDLFEAAKVDGAGPFRIFWSIVLPMSKPIIGVISLLTIMAAWKEFLWPMLVLPDPTLQPLSVVLPRLEQTSEMSLLMASLFISVIIPVLLFLVFQRQFLRGAGQAGALKG
ncbi:carbohydrate ABC transporter permease [Jiangella sp. DSM 45060]|uniref:carbohydrate ABC transporter permease n=1 Tax=Jiangella sp. DSM 45060 TaxID=1798224 RepID=UPI00087BC25A|nr:carbohydrate ABC transporter permease [Jiangella sp. DSM 45060]SDS46841.1 multiple sugar transport system permease protein [Jiangella sp. DSM 45060]